MNPQWEVPNCSAYQSTGENSFSMTCSDVTFDNSLIYIAVVGLNVDGEVKVSADESIRTEPAVVKNFVLNISGSVQDPFDIAVNFQPAGYAIPDGFSSDSGLAFDATRGYGWNPQPSDLQSRDRNNESSPDQAYDTLVYFSDPDSIWEVTVPNGNYVVTVCMGDPSLTGDLNQSVQAEGSPIIDNGIIPVDEWLEQSASITVTDGRLSVTFNGTDYVRLSWIKVTSQ